MGAWFGSAKTYGIAGSGHAADARVQHLGPSGNVAELPVFVATDRPEESAFTIIRLVRWNRSRHCFRPPPLEKVLRGAVAELAMMIPSMAQSEPSSLNKVDRSRQPLRSLHR